MIWTIHNIYKVRRSKFKPRLPHKKRRVKKPKTNKKNCWENLASENITWNRNARIQGKNSKEKKTKKITIQIFTTHKDYSLNIHRPPYIHTLQRKYLTTRHMSINHAEKCNRTMKRCKNIEEMSFHLNTKILKSNINLKHSKSKLLLWKSSFC